MFDIREEKVNGKTYYRHFRQDGQEVFYRTYPLERARIDEKERTVPVSFSSEEPVRRWFGMEILDHQQGAADLSFLSSGRAPVLKDHWRDVQTGVVKAARIDKDKRGRALLRFGNSAAAKEEFQDVLDGIRSNVSVGYTIAERVLEKEDKTGDTYRVTQWTPVEISIVSIPADMSVGVGRSDNMNPSTCRERRKNMSLTQEEKTKIAEDVRAQVVKDISAKKQAKRSHEDEAERIRKAENIRATEILAIGDEHNFKREAVEAVKNGKTVDQFRAMMLAELKKRGLKPVDEPPEIGLSDKEKRQFSFIRAINALANPTKQEAQEAAAFEYEVSRAAADKAKKEAAGIMVPVDILRHAPEHMHTRDLVKGTPTAGGNLVATDLLSGSFIDILTNAMLVAGLGAVQMRDLVGDVAIPRATGGATSYWVAESGAPTESQQAFDQVALTPKTVGAYTDISRKLLKQSSIDVENFVKFDLARTLALAIDLASIAGPGTGNQPTGILNMTGINSVAFAAVNLGEPTWAEIVQMETEIATDNALLGNLAYVTTPAVNGYLKTTEKSAGTARYILENGEANGYPVKVTNQMSAGHILFGNWMDLIIAWWSGLDITVDPYSNSTSGTIRVVALQDCDINARHPQSFCDGT